MKEEGGSGSSAVQALWDGGGRRWRGADVTASSEELLIFGWSRRFERHDMSWAVQFILRFSPTGLKERKQKKLR